MSAWLRLVMLIGLSLWSSLAAIATSTDYGFRIIRAELQPEAEDLVLNADIDYRFSDTAIEALRNGVPLTLVLRLKILRERRFWLDEAMVTERRVFRINYHSLSKLYQMRQEDSGSLHNFATLTALLEAMGAVRGLTVVPIGRLEAEHHYRARLSVELDIESLPLPLRPIAYVSPAWYLNSPPYKWSFGN